MEPEAEIIRAQLFALQDETYRTFHSALMPTVPPETVIGVRVPALRRLAKQLAGTAQAEVFLQAQMCIRDRCLPVLWAVRIHHCVQPVLDGSAKAAPAGARSRQRSPALLCSRSYISFFSCYIYQHVFDSIALFALLD